MPDQSTTLTGPAEADRHPVRPPGRRWAVLASLVAGLLILSSCSGIGGQLIHSAARASTGVSSGIHLVPQITSQALDEQAVANKVSPGIVDINTVLSNGSRSSGEAAGTGMVLTSSGEVLTNHHVVEQASSIKVTVPSSSRTYTARVLGVDTSADVALLQLQGASNLATVTLADSSNVTTGEPVVAIGNALGQGGSPRVTSGEVTALDQSITASAGPNDSEDLTGLIQSNAPISPGDSGGALANASGQVIGMITAGAAGRFNRTTSRIGFAVPSSTALDVVNRILSGQTNSTTILGDAGFLGVGAQPLDSVTASRLGLSSGVVVTSVSSGSPADQAGIRQGVVITQIEGTTINSTNDLRQAIKSHHPGERIKVTWVDQSGTHSATATLISGPAA
jgi:S1-C subfamily serine protease